MASVYELVTERIMDQLDKGIIPWQKPWIGRAKAWSRSTGKTYSFINQCLLPYEGEYATFKQIQAEGGKVKAGEKASMVVFYKLHIVEEEVNGEIVKKKIPTLKYYYVFNIANQVEGLEEKHNIKGKYKGAEPISECENLIESYTRREGIKIYPGPQALYNQTGDYIVLPKKKAFIDTPEYYSTAFHEIAHSTGHEKRLNRGLGKSAFGDSDYSAEELVAEITSAAILNTVGIETPGSMRNNIAYIQNWLGALKNDKRMVVFATGRAEKAYNMIMEEPA